MTRALTLLFILAVAGCNGGDGTTRTVYWTLQYRRSEPTPTGIDYDLALRDLFVSGREIEISLG